MDTFPGFGAFFLAAGPAVGAEFDRMIDEVDLPDGGPLGAGGLKNLVDHRIDDPSFAVTAHNSDDRQVAFHGRLMMKAERSSVNPGRGDRTSFDLQMGGQVVRAGGLSGQAPI